MIYYIQLTFSLLSEDTRKKMQAVSFFVKLQAILLRLYWCKMFEIFSEQQSLRIPWRTVSDTLRYHIKVQWHSG